MRDPEEVLLDQIDELQETIAELKGEVEELREERDQALQDLENERQEWNDADADYERKKDLFYTTARPIVEMIADNRLVLTDEAYRIDVRDFKAAVASLA